MARNQKLSNKMKMLNKARTKLRSHCKILDRELNYMKTKYSHFEIEHELSEERILMPYVTSSK